ncbi:MAG: hypothetical protein MJE66_05600 [Proteobacteria bacterium]|nr:hypothetical protein [Pseudomonadota bacterium]
MQYLKTALLLLTGVAMGVAGTRFWNGAREPEPLAVPIAQVANPEVAARPETAPPGAERLPPDDALPPEAESHPQYFADRFGQAEPAPEELPAVVTYPRLEKLAPEPLSDVPHELLGAWDEDRESATPGARRALVLVVSPDLDDAALEALARDVRDRHRDARILDVKIYDSARAAIQSRSLDGGALAFAHLVASVRKNDAVPVDVIRIRGRRLDP